MRRVWLAVGGGAVATVAALALALPAGAVAAGVSQATCHLAAPYQHVIYVQFDNTHLFRDNPNVPSDLAQIPNLKNFLTSKGALLNNDHTILISHTAGGIISALTGLYPDRNGITESNTQIQYVTPQTNAFPSAFSYWTDPLSTTDSAFNLITAPHKNTPAPWVPYTRAGCDVGAFSIADMELENTKTTTAGDIYKVFGANSPQVTFANWSNNVFFNNNKDPDGDGDGPKDGNLAVADFEGIAVHCAQADSGASAGICSTQNGGQPDVLPTEQGGYGGFNGLFGGVYVNQITSHPGHFTPATADDDGKATTPGGPKININDVAPGVKDVYDYKFPDCQYCAGGPLGAPTSMPIGDSTGNSGFPGFDPTAAQTLGYVASMQEAGIPVTFAYIADAHDNHKREFAFGPGQKGYVAQLAAENQAFGAFLERLAHDGITKANTLFVFTVDEGDHFAGGTPINTGCDGVNVPCEYQSGTKGLHTIGEQDMQIGDALQKEFADTTPFNIRFDDAPAFQVNAPAGATSPPGPHDPSVRQLERDVGRLTVGNQRTGQTDQVTQHIADQSDLSILHMINADPLRTPSFVLFGNPDYFYETFSCTGGSAGCPVVDPGFAWNHGDDNPEIAQTWVGYVGPTIQNLGETGFVWTDHTDVRPTMLMALGLSDHYHQDGNAITQVLDPSSLPANIQAHLASYEDLAGTLKQLNAPFGQFGHDSEIVSTTAVESSSPGDAVDKGFDQQLEVCGSERAALVAQIQPILQNAEFAGGTIDDSQAQSLVNEAYNLIGSMHALSQMVVPPDFTVCSTSSPAVRAHGGAGATAAAALLHLALHVSAASRSVTVRSTAVGLRATVAISRGHDVLAYGSGSLRHLTLRVRTALHGRYLLSVEARGLRALELTIHV
jgi:hypothetical protein